MALGNFFKSLFGGSSSASKDEVSEPVAYKEFTIEAAPINEDGKFRTAGYIGGELNGEVKRIQFIRADQSTDRQTAIDHSISKAQQIIDDQGIALLQKSHL
jgi:hypothetical protein